MVRLTFAGRSLAFTLADALHVHLAGLPQLSAVVALGDGAAFLLDFKQGTIGVLAGRRAVAFDAGFARGTRRSAQAGARGEERGRAHQAYFLSPTKT